MGVNWKRVGKDVGGVALVTGIGLGASHVLSNRKSSNSSSSSSGSKSKGRGSSSGTGSSSSTGTGSSSSNSSSGSRSSSSSSSFKRANPSQYAVQSAKLEVPENIYVQPKQYSLQRVGMEVYETDEENYQPYSSELNTKASENEKFLDVEDPNITNQSDDSGLATENDYDTTSFKLHRGEILDTFYYDDVASINFESDYREMSNSGTLNKHDVNLQQFYKGVRLKILSEWEEPSKTLQWDDLKTCLDGWIINQTFKDEEVEIKLTGTSVLLEQTLAFKFQQLPRSRILYEIILTAGLTPWINMEGLDDDITDFTNEASTNNKNSNSSNAPIGKYSSQAGALAQQICQGKNTDLAKAQAIHSYIQQHVKYPSPNYSDHHRCPNQVLKTGISNCCDRARLGHEMANAVGLKNRGVHGPNHVWVQYHINGKWVDSDPGDSRPKLGSVWKGMGVDRLWSFPSC